MPSWILKVDVTSGPVPLVVWGVTVVLLLVLLIRRRSRRSALRAMIGTLVGAFVGVFALCALKLSGVLLSPPPMLGWWASAGFALLGFSAVGLGDSKPWRRVVAAATVLMLLISVSIGANAEFGINRTVGDVLGRSTLETARSLPGPVAASTSTGPLYARWKPPADMPAKGQVLELSGDLAIPSRAGFAPRNASIYLPPAALVDDPPSLPLVVHMMGQPGDPNPQFIQEAMDALAAENGGLAPIVIVADQLGGEDQNPACADSAAFGGVSTYFNQDIPAYATRNLPVMADHRYWTISGYSNGGACAFAWGAGHPNVWGNIVSISGEEYQGSEESDAVLAQIFGGDQDAYEAAKPAAVAARNQGMFDGHVAVFTVGDLDQPFVPAARASAAAAEAAGFETSLFVIPEADHVVTGLRLGLPQAYRVLFPHLGLAPPSP